jgi:N utilization substance protein B
MNRPERPERSGAPRGEGAPGAQTFERTPPKSARRRSRELAIQGLYQWLVSPEDAGAIEAHLASTSPSFEKADRDHFCELLHGSIRDIDLLHAQISPFIDRPLNELSPVEHAALLVGAVLAHFTVLSAMGVGAAVPAMVLGVLAAVTLWANRGQLGLKTA